MRGSFIAFAVALLGVSSQAIAQDIHWHTEYQTALEEARKANKPILLAFRCAP
jgi:hypothetical protein